MEQRPSQKQHHKSFEIFQATATSGLPSVAQMGQLAAAATREEIQEWMYRGRKTGLTFDFVSDTSAVLTFDFVSDTSAYGNTKSFQSGFGNRKIRISGIKLHPTDEYADFFCVREPAFDLEELEACTQELQHILGDGCLKSSPAIVRMKNLSQCDTTALLALVESLKECANVLFDM
jgi:hypothetical protein